MWPPLSCPARRQLRDDDPGSSTFRSTLEFAVLYVQKLPRRPHFVCKSGEHVKEMNHMSTYDLKHLKILALWRIVPDGRVYVMEPLAVAFGGWN